jgi:hypothetical protein
LKRKLVLVYCFDVIRVDEIMASHWQTSIARHTNPSTVSAQSAEDNDFAASREKSPRTTTQSSLSSSYGFCK